MDNGIKYNNNILHYKNNKYLRAYKFDIKNILYFNIFLLI